MYDAFDWDESKAAGNERKHGLALADGAEAMRSARFWLIRQDTRYDYGERRYQCIVADPDLPHLRYVVVFTPRPPLVRLISVRLANRKEREAYDRAIR